MKLFLKALNFFFSGYFNFIASLASVTGLLIVVFSNNYSTLIALSAIIIFLTLILLRLFIVIKAFILQKTDQGYHKFATYIRYSTEDGRHIAYELHKYLQCKTVVMDEYEHNFYWTGSCDPQISSSLQHFKEFVRTPKGEYDKAIFRFKKPLSYNEFGIIHIKMDLDDSDQKSKPFCEQAVREKIQLINFRIELKHLPKGVDARILKRRINSQLMQDEENIGFVRFDQNSKSYEHSVFDPEVGYYYKIEWDK